MGTKPPDIAGLTEWHPLARGGFAMVWEARQTTLNRLVAVKVDERRLDTDGERRRFLREAGAAGRMSGHAGIVTVHDAGILPDDRPYLVMELCTGGSLNTWAKRAGGPTEPAVVEVGIRIADALAAAHAVGVIHRDVKPANILIDAYGRAGLADFGLAAIPEPDAPPEEALEALTPTYAPPEVLGGEPATAAGDVYALAATLYGLLAGHSPRWSGPGTPTPAMIAAKRGEPIEPIPDVSPALMGALLTALSDDPSARPTAVEFRDRLSASRPVTDNPVPAQPIAVRETQRRNWLVLVAVGIIVLGVVSAWLVGRTNSGAAAPAHPLHGPLSIATPSSSPTPAAAPAGFVDCSRRAGEPALCPTRPECWTSVFSYMDSPFQAVAQACPKSHVYQTFAAVQLTEPLRRQSQIDKAKAVRAVCTSAVVNRLMIGGRIDHTWEVMVIPPQFDNDTVYRCIAGKGNRVGALRFAGG